MRNGLAIAVGLFVTTSANAQFTNCVNNGPFVNCYGSDGTITNCNRTGEIVNCHSMGGATGGTGPTGSPTYQSDSGAELGKGIVALVRSINERKAKSRVYKALQAGDCDTAAQHALKSKSAELARVVLGQCAPRN